MPRKPEATAKVHPKASAKRKPASKPKASAKPKGKAKAGAKTKPDPNIEVEKIIARYRGRPTKYDPAYCEMVICWGRFGKSKTWMAAEMMIERKTLDNWAADNPEFLRAISVAKHLEQQHWEDLGYDNARSVGFQSAMWSRSMAARFPAEWREKTQVDHGISGELAVLLGQIDGHGASLV